MAKYRTLNLVCLKRVNIRGTYINPFKFTTDAIHKTPILIYLRVVQLQSFTIKGFRDFINGDKDINTMNISLSDNVRSLHLGANFEALNPP